MKDTCMRRKCIMVFTMNIVPEYHRVPVVVIVLSMLAWLSLAEIPLYEFESLDIVRIGFRDSKNQPLFQ